MNKENKMEERTCENCFYNRGSFCTNNRIKKWFGKEPKIDYTFLIGFGCNFFKEKIDKIKKIKFFRI